jgi:hypothetical protein
MGFPIPATTTFFASANQFSSSLSISPDMKAPVKRE